jgi:hypothetical protein
VRPAAAKKSKPAIATTDIVTKVDVVDDERFARFAAILFRILDSPDTPEEGSKP